jgi:hypothetical protein
MKMCLVLLPLLLPLLVPVAGGRVAVATGLPVAAVALLLQWTMMW